MAIEPVTAAYNLDMTRSQHGEYYLISDTFESQLMARIADLQEWLDEQGEGCCLQQKHLIESSPERIYWHYGYLVALKDVLRFFNESSSPTE